ncbi:MAG: hypothetical protein OQK03_00860 [Colwellia sp.]|nr:hypothetical protein [Colwellia sp.]
MKKFFIAMLSCLLLMNISCADQEQISVKEKTSTWLQVKVIYLNFEGGFYGLVTENGDKLLPMNLAKEYKAIDTLLNIKGHKVEGIATTQQWGTLFKITDVKLIQLGERKAPNEY